MIYYGITIGPIVKTLGMTNTPAGLWTASYMFSYITKTLIELLKNNDVDILIPYYDEDESSNEVGSYPDHIIFKGNNINNEDIKTIINNAKEKIANIICKSLFSDDKSKLNDVINFMNKYISIQCVKKDISDEQNVLLEMSRLLDHIELSESFVMTDNGQFLSMLFSGDGNTSDSSKAARGCIRNFINLIKGEKQKGPQVQNQDGSLKDIKSICNISLLEDLKITDYYAIVYADGDNMTSLFKNLPADKLSVFSQNCLQFTKDAAKEIEVYGGVTIYAGGDDLLFIVPLCSKSLDNGKRKSIFELCKELSDKFSNDMNRLIQGSNVSMSFGVSVSFLRSPLYEAFEEARAMLWEAKNLNEDEKNSLAVKLSKASGQSLSMCMSFKSELYTEWIKFLNDYYINVKKENNEKKDESFDSDGTEGLDKIGSQKNNIDIDMVKSITYTIENYYKLYKIATDKITEDKNSIKNFFINMTDNSHQESYKTYIERVSELYIKLDEAEKQNKFKFIGDNDKKNTALSGILRLSKFYLEKSNQDKEGKA